MSKSCQLSVVIQSLFKEMITQNVLLSQKHCSHKYKTTAIPYAMSYISVVILRLNLRL